MITRLAKKCVAASVKGNIIPPQEAEFFTFAFSLLLSQAFGIATCVIIGLLFQCVIESMVYLMFFIPLRTFSGGFHAGSHLKCYISSVLLFGLSVGLGVSFGVNLPLFVVTALYAGCMLTILLLAPAEDKNKPLTEPEVEKCRMRVRLMAAVYSVLFAVACCFSETRRYGVFLLLAVATVAILVVISKIAQAAGGKPKH